MPRYIDAEKVEKWLHRDDWGTPDARWRPEEEFGKMIDSMPTEDVQEVKHGKWIDKGTYCVCSVCNHTNEPQFDGVQPIPCFTPYCSMCGAKMDGTRKENEDGKAGE